MTAANTGGRSSAVRVAVRAAVVADGRLLLIGYPDPTPHFNLPGGTARPDETLAATAIRKVSGEFGVAVTPARLLFVHETLPAGTGSDPDVHHKFEFVLLAHLTAGATLRQRPGSVGAPTWVPLAEIRDVPLLPPIQRRLADALAAPATGDDPLLAETTTGGTA